MPSGRLIRKIIRQPVPNRFASTRKPPTIGPSTAPMPITGPNAASGLAMSAGGNASRIRPKPCGSISAANAPCTTRPPARTSGDHARAQSIDAAVKPTVPIRSILRRPTMSPSRPPTISSTASASV